MPLVEQMSAVLGVFLILGMLLWMANKRGFAQFRIPMPGSQKRRAMEVVERLPLTPQHSLHLVRVSGKTLLIGVSPAGCSVLDAPGLEETGR
ncbi:MAG: flagellar biosynthetic protein FliO [Acidobacteria bacterium]|nr:flagellar biosynthetic protein FliO [Acidobacteriota bacterium]